MSKHKKYISFISYLDDTFPSLQHTIELKTETKEVLDESMKKVEDIYYQKYTNNDKTVDKVSGSANPNKYKETLFVLLEEEMLYSYFAKNKLTPLIPLIPKKSNSVSIPKKIYKKIFTL